MKTTKRLIAAALVLGLLLAMAAGCAMWETEHTMPSVPTPIIVPTEPSTVPTAPPVTEPTATEPPATQPPDVEPPKKLLTVCIDAGHQRYGISEKEPNGPGSNVVMVRRTNDCPLSNAERAQVANSSGADIFIRIHANGSENPETNGIVTICQTKNNPFNKELHEQCYRLSEAVLEEMADATGAKALYIWETDTMSGINWCKVPVTIVEMGFMSNKEEDQKMATDAYQDKLALGIADGIDRYFESIA